MEIKTNYDEIHLMLTSIRNQIANGQLDEKEMSFLKSIDNIDLKDNLWKLLRYGIKKTIEYWNIGEYDISAIWIQFTHNIPKKFSNKEKWDEEWFYEGELLSLIENIKWFEIKECIQILGKN